MSTFKAPLSNIDAHTIEHAAEVRILVASERFSTIEDAARYGEARRWLTQLLMGESVEIDEAELAESRKIMSRTYAASAAEARP